MNRKSLIFSSFIWRFLERFGAQGVTVVVSLILARILEPEAYGVVALITVFTNILNVFVEGGLGSALIQKKDADNIDFSSVFIFNLFVSVLCYIIMFNCAPLIAKFYDNENLVSMIRALSVIIIISGVKNIQQAYVSRNMLFKKFFFATLGGTITAAIIGIVLAKKGVGAWAIIVQYLTNASIDTIILWLTVEWRPQMTFSVRRLKDLIAYGWKLMVSGLIYSFYNEFRGLIIGKKYSTSDLAYYDKAYTFPRYIVQIVNNSLDSVIFPIMSKQQDNNERLRCLAKQTITMSTYIMFPIMAGLFVCAKPIIIILLSSKWVECVPYLRVFCIICAFWSFDTVNQNILKSTGKSDSLLMIEIIETIISIILLLYAMNYGTFAIAVAWCCGMFVNQIIVSIPSKKIIGYGYVRQLIDILPNAIITLLMAIVVWLISLLRMNYIIQLGLQVFLGGIVYLVLSWMTNNKSFILLIKYYKQIKSAKKNKKM